MDDDLDDFSLKALAAGQDVRKAIKDGRLEIDLNGHYRNGAAVRLNYLVEDAFSLIGLNKGIERLNRAIENKKPLARSVSLGRTFSFRCPECGQPLRWRSDGKSLWASNACPYPHGLPSIEFDLNVPSGVMVVANDLRDGFRIMGDYDINMTAGMVQTSLKYADTGMAHCFVGNTCPSMYKVGDRSYVIAPGGRRGWRRVATVCTDLWWYSIVDFEEYERRYGTKPVANATLDLVKCQPGVYCFSHHYHRLSDRDARGVIYTHIAWAAPPAPLRDFKGEWMALDFTAGQVIADKLRKYPDLFGRKTLADSIQRAADQLMVVNGNGSELHPNGWLGSNPDLKPGARSVKIPVFDKQYRWYPLSDFSFLASVAGMGSDCYPRAAYYNESFTDLAFNICQCIVRYGSEPSWHGGERQAKSDRRLAKRFLVGLAKKYPDRIPAYCRDLLPKKIALDL